MKDQILEEHSKLIKTRFSLAWKKFYPRRIVPPHDYYDPKYWATVNIRRQTDGSDIPREMLIIQKHLLNSDVPTYFLDDAFAEAIVQTKPDVIRLADVKLPLDEMLICLSQTFSKKYLGYNIPFISYALSRPTNPDHKVFIYDCMLITSNAQALSYAKRITTNRVIEEDDQIMDEKLIQQYQEFMLKYDCIKEIPQNEEEIKKLGRGVFQLLYKMFRILNTGRPFMERGVQTRKEKLDYKGEVVKDALWSPNFIGNHYRSPKSNGQGQSHASPRLHWRIGHIRHQRYGPMKEYESGKHRPSLIKEIWIEPILIGSSYK